MKVITFSRYFPSYHLRKGEPTLFIEKIWESIYLDNVGSVEFENLSNDEFDLLPHGKYTPKHHTIRAGKRFKEGEWFSPRFWSGIPYRSKQTTFAPPLQIKKIWNIDIYKEGDVRVKRENQSFMTNVLNPGFQQIAKNDGLTVEDMAGWFKIPTRFTGQIICWNENLNY